MLLVSPERLNNPGFRDEVLPRLAATCGLLVVDEAHCISDWGHDFRPDYRRIRTLLADLPDGIPVLATTATANPRVTDDVAEQLGADTLMLRGSLDRESLRLGVVRLRTAEQRLAWLADHLAEQPGSGIVYCLTVAATQEVAGYLRSRGHAVAAYSGQTEPTERLALEQDLLDGRVKALVATSALGMGFDATLGFVVNLGAPQSPVAYYQQVGRAGRGSAEGASVVLLPAIEDRDIWAYFASLAFPREELVRDDAARRSPTTARCRTAALETHVELQPHPARDDAQGARRRRRRTPGPRRLGGDRAGVGLRRGALPPGRRGARARAAGDARLPRHRRVPDGVPARPARRPRGRAVRPLRQLRRAGALRRRSARPPIEEAGARLVPARAWRRAAQDVADRAGHARDRPQGQDRRRRRGGPGGRPADRPRPRPGAARAVRRPTTARSRCRWSRAVVEVLGDWRPPVEAIVARRVGDPAHADRATSPRGSPRYLGVPVVGRWAIVDPDVEPGRGAANSAQRVAAVGRRLRRSRARSRPGRCCSSTTWSSPAGRSPWPPGRCARRAPPRSSRWCSALSG